MNKRQRKKFRKKNNIRAFERVIDRQLRAFADGIIKHYEDNFGKGSFPSPSPSDNLQSPHRTP